MHLALPRPQPGVEGDGSLSDRLCGLLERRGRPLQVGHIAAQLLRLRRCPPRLQRQLVAELVEGDARLAWLGHDLVGLAPDRWHDARLDQARFCVVDLETTGGSPGRARVTEIGAVRVSGLRIEERFTTLVDPGWPIPQHITALTGIDDAMVQGSPPIERALEDFVHFAGDDVLVAHNAPFDLRFLNYERRRLAGRYFTQPWLDTLVLSRRLLAGRVGRHDLATLAEWAGTATRPCHRALPDAEATAELLVCLAGLLFERGEDTLARAVAVGAPRGPRHAYKLALAEDLPASPGVYLMRDAGGTVLYVGKAVNLRRRVRSYFGPAGPHGRLVGRALERLEAIDHEICGSDFEALLRESELLRELRPACNHRGVGPVGRYLRLTGGPSSRLYATARPRSDGATYFGPVRSDRVLRDGLSALHRLYRLRRCHPLCAPGAPRHQLHAGPGVCGGPCSGADPEACAAEVAEVGRLLEGDAAALGRLAARIAAGAADGRLDPQDEGDRGLVGALLALLAALARSRRALGAPAVLVERAAGEGAATVFFVARGQVVHREVVRGRAWRRAARRGLARIAEANGRPPGPLPAGALDAALIVADRLRERRGEPGAASLAPGGDPEVALETIGRAIAAGAPPAATP